MSTSNRSYPGQLCGRGYPAPESLVRLIQRQLKTRGYGSLKINGQFDRATESSVRLFQAQHVDRLGKPLRPDGIVGPLTWASLFIASKRPAVARAGGLSGLALGIASTQVGVLEKPPGSNKGPEVNQYLQSVGIGPGVADPAHRYWCAAFVYWCFIGAAESSGIVNPVICTPGVLKHWRAARKVVGRTITKAEILGDPSLVRPGMIFIHDYGKGLGHTGLVERVDSSGRLITVEGNINPEADSRNGIGVFRTDRRTIMDDKLIGMIRY